MNVCDEEQVRMPEGSEFHTEGAATLKPRGAKVMWTRGTDNRLICQCHHVQLLKTVEDIAVSLTLSECSVVFQ